jgi:cell division protein FtsL
MARTGKTSRRVTDTTAYAAVPNTKSGAFGVLLLLGVVTFILIFTYLSLNLKNIDFGYEMQDLIKHRKSLVTEIDRLKSQKAVLLSLERVEKKVIDELGYQYPEPDQFIKVFEDQK